MAMAEPTADEINAAAERVRQDVLREIARKSSRAQKRPVVFVQDDDLFDVIPGTGGLLLKRDREKACSVPPDGHYGGELLPRDASPRAPLARRVASDDPYETADDGGAQHA